MMDDFDDCDWIPAGVRRLREDLQELLHPGDDDPQSGEPIWWLQDMTGFDPGAIDAAIDRAVATVKKARKEVKRELEHRERVRKVMQKPGFWALYRYREGAIARAALELSAEERYRDLEQMLFFARIACNAAGRLDPAVYPAVFIHDMRAETAIELANTWRVLEDYAQADAVLQTVEDDRKRGSGDPRLAGLKNEVEGRLRVGQRRLPEALERFDRAHALYLESGDRHLAGRARVSRGRALYTGGDAAGAVVCLEEGMALLDPARDPRLIATSTQALIGYLVACGEHRRAGELLMESGLGQAFEDEPLNKLRLRWVEAQIHAGLDRLDRAEAAFREVREGFQAHQLEYDAALAGIELGIVWLRQGERKRLKQLAKEMIATFTRLNLATKEARQALLFLEVTCSEEIATIGVLQRTRDFLERHRVDASVKFDPRYMLLGY